MGLAVLIGIVWVVCLFSGKNAAHDVGPQSEATGKTATAPAWHHAESKEEVARRVKERLVGELTAHRAVAHATPPSFVAAHHVKRYIAKHIRKGPLAKGNKFVFENQ